MLAKSKLFKVSRIILVGLLLNMVLYIDTKDKTYPTNIAIPKPLKYNLKSQNFNSDWLSVIYRVSYAIGNGYNCISNTLTASLIKVDKFWKKLTRRVEIMDSLKAYYSIARIIVNALLWCMPLDYRDEARETFWEGEDHTIKNGFQYFYGGIEYRLSIFRRIVLPNYSSALKKLFQEDRSIGDQIPEESYFISQNH